MRTRTPLMALALLLAAASGCSSTYGRKSSWFDRGRTVASAGGKPLPVQVGPPGDEITAELEEPESPPRSEGTISGRVVDARGRPVADAEVRPADGSGRSGRDLRATTDSAGGFTLRGLRPGASYTLVAEGGAGRDALVGRAKVRAPDRRVRIALGEDDTTAEAEAEPPRRVGRVSGREDVDGGDIEGGEPEPPPALRPTPRINPSDLPPAEEAEAIETRRDRDSSTSRMVSRVAWQPRAAEPIPAPSEPLERPDRDPDPHPPREARAEPPKSSEPEPEGPNPLPPAKERPLDSAPAESVPVGTAHDPPPPAAEAGDKPSAAPDPAKLDPTPPVDTPATIKGGGTLPDPALSEAPTSPISAEAGPRHRATWNDLPEPQPRLATNFPISGRRSSPPPAPADVPARKGLGGLFAARAETPAATEDTAFVAATCEFDARKQRIVDFQLPDMDGKPVHFRDLDADYVLIDFWGTWCKPCRDSIPHLTELQTRYGPGTLRVVGVATEHEGSPAERAKKVADVAQSLGVNYSLLLSEADGKPCPLQEALHIQAYPTMLLLDRTGRILWRGTGAELQTLARLDRVIALRAESAVIRR